MSLTETKIKNLKAKEKPYKVADADGLYLNISIIGTKTWRFKYYFEKKEFTIKIGDYPLISLKDARDKILEYKLLLTKGINPKEEINKEAKTKEKSEIKSFDVVAEEWLGKQKTWSAGHRKTVEYRLHRYISNFIGKKDISTLLPTDLLNFLRKIEADNKHETASRALGVCSQVFRYGVACGYCTQDPCRDLRGALTNVKPKPRAAITDEKGVAVLMGAIHKYSRPQMKNALLFSAYTFCRPGEIRHAEWSEINFEKEEWKIPAEKMKMRKEHRVPLAEQCIKILKSQLGYDKQWVFPSPRPGKPMSEVGVLSAIRNLGYSKEEMCAHGFRSMASTLLNEQGYKADLIEKSLAHGDDDSIRGIYNRTDYFEERRKMMQEWADYLDKLAGIECSNEV